jgi:hypothetical protein
MADQPVREGVRVAARPLEVRDAGHRRGKHGQRRVVRRRRGRVAARLEVPTEPLQREPADARVGAACQPRLNLGDPAVGLLPHHDQADARARRHRPQRRARGRPPAAIGQLISTKTTPIGPSWFPLLTWPDALRSLRPAARRRRGTGRYAGRRPSPPAGGSGVERTATAAHARERRSGGDDPRDRLRSRTVTATVHQYLREVRR